MANDDIPEVPDIDSATVELELDEPGTVKFARLAEETEADFIEELLTGNALDHIEELWNNRSRVIKQYEAQQDGDDQ